jgi:hypothetical protein
VAMIILLTTSLMVTSWHDCWFQVARSVQSGDHFLQADFERSRWRGGRFACYAPHVMPQRNGSNCGSRTCSFSKYRKTNSLQMGEKIEFP